MNVIESVEMELGVFRPEVRFDDTSIDAMADGHLIEDRWVVGLARTQPFIRDEMKSGYLPDPQQMLIFVEAGPDGNPKTCHGASHKQHDDREKLSSRDPTQEGIPSI